MAKKEQSGQPRSAGYRILHETLCVIAALLLFFCFCNTAALRIYSRSDSLSAGLRASRISDAEVPFTGKNVTDYIMSGYVDDSEVLSEDIQTAADSMKIPEFLAEKFEQQSALLRGDANEPLQITPDEISGKLDQISEELYASCKLIIEESDRTQIESALEKPLSVFNSVSGAFGSTKAGRLVLRFGVSIFAYIAEAVLIVLLLLRWGKIRKNSGKDSEGCLKGMGTAIMIPAALILFFVLVGGTATWFTPDTEIGLNPFYKALRAPFWWISVTGVTFSLFLLELCAYLRARRDKANAPAAASAPAEAPSAPVPPSARKLPADQKYCMHCGKPIAANAKFCIYCGTDQNTSAAADTQDERAKVTLEKDADPTEENT